MSKIDYQALRELAKQATQGEWVAFISPGKYGTYAVHTPGDNHHGDIVDWPGFDEQKNAENNARYIAAFNPEVVQALLDERERKQQYIKRRDQENEDIALTVGKLRVELEGKDSKIANLTAERDALREGEMGDARHSNTRAAADIYFQLVEECEIPAGGSLVEYVDDMREKLEAAENNLIDSECHVAELEEALRDKQALLEASEKRIAELEAELVSQTYKLNELSGNSPVTPDGWISCSERMPEKGQNVLISVNFDSSLVEPLICSARYTGSTFRRGDATIKPGNGIEQATHWMPLPEPPQEVNRG